MTNNFGVPEEVESAIRARHPKCAYCGKKMKAYANVKGCHEDKATLEHLNCRGPYKWKGRSGVKESDLVMCCGSCNSSRGRKTLPVWFKSEYCIDRNINEQTVAQQVKDYLNKKKVKQGTCTIQMLRALYR